MPPNAPPQWHLDRDRNAWYYYSPAESCLVYQDGLRLPVARFSEPKSPPPAEANQANSLTRDFGRAHITEPSAPNPYGSYQQQQPAYQTPISAPYHYYGGTPPSVQYGQGQYAAQSIPYQPQPPTTRASSLEASRIERPREGPPLQDPRVRFVRGTRGGMEKMDSRFQVRKPGKKFFREGVVFKILWPEAPNALSENRTVATEIAGVTTDPHFGERIYVKIRWFVVIREGQNCASCLPLQTYGSQGAGKPGLNKEEHAIVFTGDKPPKPFPTETEGGKDVLLRPIRVIPRLPSRDKIDPWCRINFGKVYTVEHNVKVYDWGKVDPRWKGLLKTQFRQIFLDVNPDESEDYEDEDEDDE